jgi:hypothetical protein
LCQCRQGSRSQCRAEVLVLHFVLESNGQRKEAPVDIEEVGRPADSAWDSQGLGKEIW